MPERVRLGELLVETGLVTRAALDEALSAQGRDGRRLGELLVDAGVISEAKVTQVLSQQLSVPWVSLSHIDFSRQLLNLVPPECAQKYGVVPIYVRRSKNREQTLYIAMTDPTDPAPLQEIAAFSGLPVRPMIAPPKDIRGAIRVYYLGLPPEPEASAPAAAPPATAQAPSATSAAATGDAPKAPEVKLKPVEPVVALADEEEAPNSSRTAQVPAPRHSEPPQKMVTVTLLDGTQIRLPAKRRGSSGQAAAAGKLTARDLIAALRVRGHGGDASEVLGENVNWELMFSSLLSLLLKKHLIHDWEFVDELNRS